MGNLMSCVLICGAVEVVQVVHSDGHVERLIRPIESCRKLPSKRQDRQEDSHEKQQQIVNPLDISKILSSACWLDQSTIEPLSGNSSYLLLPIHNKNKTNNDIIVSNNKDTSSSSSSSSSSLGYKYRRLSSFQFYKSALFGSTLARKLKADDPLSSSSSSSCGTNTKKENKKNKCNNGDTATQIHATGKKGGINHADEKKHLLLDSQPFKVKQEGGVTKLVVSKKYLAQLLSESKKSSSANSSNKEDGRHHHHSQQHHHDQRDHHHHHHRDHHRKSSSSSSSDLALVPSSTTKPHSSSRSNGARPSVWRPALESISEAQLASSTTTTQNKIISIY